MATVSRRIFVKSLGAGSVGALAAPWITARGHEALAADARSVPASKLDRIESAETRAGRARLGAGTAIRLDSNENPNGPGEAALKSIQGMFSEASRYPDATAAELLAAIAKHHGVDQQNIILGCGSTEILRMATYAYLSPTRPLVTTEPCYEDPSFHAQKLGAPIRAVPVDASLHLDLAGMAAAARGAGLVYFCNPNNPTATVHGAEAARAFLGRIMRESPDTTILVDEAYHHYVEDAKYATMVPLAVEEPRVIVARTFSKIYGMAGLRVGYAVAHRDTIAKLERERLPMNVNVFAATAALASLGKADHLAGELRQVHEAKELTRGFFERSGYRVIPSEANFMMVDVRRDVEAFKTACRERGVLVGRPFPPLKTMSRISMGTLDEMRQAIDVFKHVLSVA
jgi:histidinol-phosphate aminotransferase